MVSNAEGVRNDNSKKKKDHNTLIQISTVNYGETKKYKKKKDTEGIEAKHLREAGNGKRVNYKTEEQQDDSQWHAKKKKKYIIFCSTTGGITTTTATS